MNAKDLVMLGIGYFDMKKYKDSITALKKSIDIEPNNPRAYYQLGRAYLAIGDKESSLEQYNILKKLDENYAKILFEEIYK